MLVFFGLFRSIYQATCRSCKPNHVEHLKTTLRYITSALVLHNHVSYNIRQIDTIFHEWEQHLNKYTGQQHCHFRSFLEFESKHSALVSRMFAAMLD